MSGQTTTKRILLETGKTGTSLPYAATVRTAPNPNVGVLASVSPLTVVGVDFASVAIAVAGLAANTQVSASGIIQFKNLPVIQTPPGSTLWMLCAMQVSNPITGLLLQSYSIVPQVQSSGTASGIVYPGPKLPGGQTYQAYQGAVALILRSGSAATAGGNITVLSSAQLVLFQG